MDYMIVVFLLLIVLVLLIFFGISILKKKSSTSEFDKLKNEFLDISRGIEKSLAEEERASRMEQVKSLNFISSTQNERLEALNKKLSEMTEKNYEQSIKINETVTKSLDKIREENSKKLDEIRGTVNEKLDKTLSERLDSSFKTVSAQLNNLYKSLGEMQKLSTDVNNLNRVLTNVKSRGTWAEIQLKGILDDVIPSMYDENVRCGEKDSSVVEFGVRIPTGQGDDFYYLPIDSKFPKEDWERLLAARESGDFETAKAAKKALESRIKSESKDIKTKYINPPITTPYAILYLATEGLYAEILSTGSGLVSEMRENGIMLAGPSTMAALLNSLALGFKTVAINKKAGEVMDTLSAVKSQYDKFADILEKTKNSINTAGNNIDKAIKRNNIITKKLKSVSTMETLKAKDVLELEGIDEE